jgi:polysaccharide export outer membrane protein
MAPRQISISSVDLTRIARSVGDSEVLYSGDVIEVTITTGLEERAPEGWKLRIAENGVVEVPLIGPVQVGGLRLTQIEQVIRDESIRRGKFVNPNVSVLLNERRSNTVTMVGAVEKPGTVELAASQSDLLGALVQAGGLTAEAGTIIEIRHPPGIFGAPPAAGMHPVSYPGQLSHGPQTLRIDLAQATLQGGGDFRLYDGSTVMVMSRQPRYIHVIGLVNQADQFEMPEDTEVRLLDAIAMARGLKFEIADKVHVIRNLDTQTEPVVIEASIKRAKRDGVSNIRLTAGDVVSVEETPTTLVVGTIRDFVRFGFSSAIPGF